MTNTTAAPPIRAWLGGTLALDLKTVPESDRLRLRQGLTLYQKSYDGDRTAVVYFKDHAGWLHVPRGYPLTAEGRWLLSRVQVKDGRSRGHPLPTGTRTTVTLGEAPFPPDQPSFVADIVAASRENEHGGLAVAPTRAGKTLCSIEAACRLGGSVLILVDREPLANQWVEAVRDHVRDGAGNPVPVGTIRGDSFDVPPARMVVVAMVQTLVRRQLDEPTRNAFRTVIVDECQSAPCSLIWTALERINSSYVIGLSATPDRKDGLEAAIAWTIGPQVATLKRELKADVHFLNVPFANAHIPKRAGSKNTREARLVRVGGFVDINESEKALMADDQRVNLIAEEAAKAVRAGRQVLILVRLRAHAQKLAKVIKGKMAVRPGVYMGGTASTEEMKRNPVIATYGIAAKGIDFKPPPTLCILAAPRSDVRQAVGRVLQPQAPHTPLILDVVDGVGPLLKQAYRRCSFYQEKGFTLRNKVWG